MKRVIKCSDDHRYPFGCKVGDHIKDLRTGKIGEIVKDGCSGNYNIIYVDFGDGKLKRICPLDDAQSVGRYDIVESATNSCGMAAKITSSDEDRVDYGYDDYEWLATKDVQDSDGFLTEYTMYRRRSDGMYVMVFGDRDIYSPEDGDFDYETEDEQDAWNWFDSYTGFDDDEEVYSSTDEIHVSTDATDEIIWVIENGVHSDLFVGNSSKEVLNELKSGKLPGTEKYVVKYKNDNVVLEFTIDEFLDEFDN